MAKSIFPAASSLGVSFLGTLKLSISTSGAKVPSSFRRLGSNLYSEVSPIAIRKRVFAVTGSNLSDSATEFLKRLNACLTSNIIFCAAGVGVIPFEVLMNNSSLKKEIFL